MSVTATSAAFAIQVDGQNPDSWNNVISQFSDANIYQTWAYGAVRWGARNLSHLAILREDQVVAVAQLRIAKLPLLPAGVAYLRWGPLFHRKDREPDPLIAEEMMKCLRREYCQRRGLSLQIIPNAYSGLPRGVSFTQALLKTEFRPNPDWHCHRTVIVDLAEPVEVLRKRFDKKWRNQLNGSEKNNLILQIDDGAKAYSEFARLYEIMWERKQFETSVDVTEFRQIQEQLVGPARMQTFLARKDGEAVAAVVCSLLGDTAIYLLGATNERARELKAAYFLHWQVMLWLKEQGARWYDLGGIDPEANPGGYHFKSGFGGVEVTQLPLHAKSGGVLSQAMLSGISQLRRQKSAAKPRAMGIL